MYQRFEAEQLDALAEQNGGEAAARGYAAISQINAEDSEAARTPGRQRGRPT